MSGSMRAQLNRFFVPQIRAPLAADPVLRFHRSLPGYAPTPLHDCPALAARLGLAAVYLKDESQRFGLGAFKALGASWALEQLRSRAAGPLTVATATAGNHGRAVAWAARRLGLASVIFISEQAAPARIAALRAEGAAVELVPGSYDDAVRRCARESAARGWQVISDTGYPGYLEIPGLIAQGYLTLFAELEQQLQSAGLPAPGVVLVQAGVGGLLHAAVMHFRAAAVQPILGAIEPVSAAALFASSASPEGQPARAPGVQDSIMAGLNCAEVSHSAWPAIRSGVELFVTVTDSFAEEAMRLLARNPDGAITAGESGAAGLAGLLAIQRVPELAAARACLRLDSASRVLLLNTEGATDPEGYRRIVGALP